MKTLITYRHGMLRRFFCCVTLAGVLAVAGCGQSPQQAMVEARGAYLAAAGAFLTYSRQPFCDLPSAPQPPLCADRAIVRQGAIVARGVETALDTADQVIGAGGKPDTAELLGQVAKFVALVAQWRQQ